MTESPGAHGRGWRVCQGGLLTRVLLTEARTLSHGAPGSYSESLLKLFKERPQIPGVYGQAANFQYLLGPCLEAVPGYNLISGA